MLKIRVEQMRVLSGGCRAAFVRRLAAHLGESYPAWTAQRDPAEVERFALGAVEAAATHGIVGRQAVTSFAELLVEFGSALEKAPERAWAQGILAHRTLPDRLKVELLCARLREPTRGRTIVEHEA